MSAALQHDPVEALNAQARWLGWPTHCDASLSFDQLELLRLIKVWRDKLNGRPMPSRADVTARDLKGILNRTLLVERIGAGEGRRYRVRLMATGLTPIWGDLTGRFVDEAVPAALLPRWHGFLDTVLAEARPLRFIGRVDFPQKDFLVAEIAAVPVSDDQGSSTMVFAAVDVSGSKSWDVIAATLRRRLSRHGSKS